jgi:hypothetical protein
LLYIWQQCPVIQNNNLQAGNWGTVHKYVTSSQKVCKHYKLTAGSTIFICRRVIIHPSEEERVFPTYQS